MNSHFFKKVFALSSLVLQLFLHFFQKLFFWRKSGLEQFKENYRSDSLLPITLGDQKTFFSFSACLNCRLCDSVCPALFKLPRERFLGPSFVLTTYSRSFHDLWASSLDLSLCQDCEACVSQCPNGIDVKHAISFIQRKVAEQIKFASNG